MLITSIVQNKSRRPLHKKIKTNLMVWIRLNPGLNRGPVALPTFRDKKIRRPLSGPLSQSLSRAVGRADRSLNPEACPGLLRSSNPPPNPTSLSLSCNEGLTWAPFLKGGGGGRARTVGKTWCVGGAHPPQPHKRVSQPGGEMVPPHSLPLPRGSTCRVLSMCIYI